MAKLATNLGDSITGSFPWKDHMFFGCYAGEGVMVGDGGDDDMGELREDEIVWGEDMLHHNETVTRYKGNDDHDAHRSMLSVQIEEEYARWSGGIISNSKVGNGAIQKRTYHQRANGEEELGDIEEEKKEEGGIITGLPPHELLAREYAATTTFSVLQGAGRTLKGMDLCRLRNKVWRQTGFVD